MRAFWLKAFRSATAFSIAAAMGVLAAYAETSLEGQFLAENGLAMKKMMTGMTVPASGDIDRDFVDMMVPHHWGAVDMARAELHFGRNSKLRGIAQKIVGDQLQEIDAMRLAVGEPPSDAAEPVKSDDGSPSLRATP